MNDYLAGHPDIFMSVKEPHYFGAEHHFLTEDQYLGLFKRAERERVVGEASVHYLASPTAPTEIARFDPDARVLIMLRHPVEVVQRLHEEMVFQGREPLTDLAAALSAEVARRAATPAGQSSPLLYREQVAFDEQVGRFLRALGHSRVHVVRFEEFAADNEAELRRVLGFLAVDEDYRPKPKVVNARKVVHRDQLHAFVLNHPQWVRTIARKALPDVVRRRLWKAAMRVSSTPGRPHAMDPRLATTLTHELAPSVRRLAELLGWDLTSWLTPPAVAGAAPDAGGRQ